MKTHNYIFILTAITILFANCTKSDLGKDMVLVVASERRPITVVDEMVDYGYIVKLDKEMAWQNLGCDIIGFDYESGYEYIIIVTKPIRKNPPIDYVDNFIMRKMESKMKKDSENLP